MHKGTRSPLDLHGGSLDQARKKVERKPVRPKCSYNSHSHNLGNESVGADWHGAGRRGEHVCEWGMGDPDCRCMYQPLLVVMEQDADTTHKSRASYGRVGQGARVPILAPASPDLRESTRTVTLLSPHWYHLPLSQQVKVITPVKPFKEERIMPNPQKGPFHSKDLPAAFISTSWYVLFWLEIVANHASRRQQSF